MSKYQALIDAPSLHDQIMNLPCVEANMEPRGSMARLAYKVGHRDARHAAAELAASQDATIRSILADLERAEKDAERYRFLRDKATGWYVGPSYETYNDVVSSGEYKDLSGAGESLDAAIDAALSQIAGGGEG